MVSGNKKVAVALSGGVDSSTCALLLKKQGFEVVGVCGKMVHSQYADTVVENARKVADFLEIELFVRDVSRKFETCVIDYFNRGYALGETPNPCLFCNKFIKWGDLFEYSLNDLGADFFATGHYAKIKHIDGFYKLFPSPDSRKDQLYFLFTMTQKQLSKTLFPLSDIVKSKTRKLALENNLPSKASKESQDVCFIRPPQTHASYLKSAIGIKKGEFVHVGTGKILGEHNGHYLFTIGQRKGVGISAAEPLYVIKIDAATNTVYLGEKPLALEKTLTLTDISRSYPFEENSLDVLTKIRYNMPPVKAHVEISGKKAQMTFAEPVYSVAAGQAGVWYNPKDGHLLGGGLIVKN